MKSYDMMTPEEKRDADRRTRMGGENEARGSENAMKGRGLKPMMPKRDKRSARKMER